MTTVNISSVLVERPTTYGNTGDFYNVAQIIIPAVAHDAAAGAGQAVTVTINASEENLPSNLNYVISACASQPCAVSFANKAYDSFDVILTPLANDVTLAAGTVDICVLFGRA